MKPYDDAAHLWRAAAMDIFAMPEARIGTEAYAELLRNYSERLKNRPMSPIELAHLERNLPTERYGIVRAIILNKHYRGIKSDATFIIAAALVSFLRPFVLKWVVQHWTKDLLRRVNNALDGRNSYRREDFTAELHQSMRRILFTL